MYNPFTKHPNEVGETYFQHMCCAFKFHCTLLKLSMCALKFSFKLECLAFCALVHAIFPFLCETTASDGIKELNDCMQKRKKK